MPRRSRPGRSGARRTTLPPEHLYALVDRLVEDPTRIRAYVTVELDTPGGDAPNRLAVIYRWLDILDDAYFLELRAAPSLGSYVRAGAGTSLAVAGVGLALTGPIVGSVIAGVGLVVGAIGGAIAFWDGGHLIRQDLTCAARLRAVELAQLELSAMADEAADSE